MFLQREWNCDSYNVGDAICSNIVILHNAESSARVLAFDQLSGRVDVVSPFGERRAVDAGFSDSGIDVLAQCWETEGVEIDSAALQTRSGSCFRSRVATDVRRRRKEAS